MACSVGYYIDLASFLPCNMLGKNVNDIYLQTLKKLEFWVIQLGYEIKVRPYSNGIVIEQVVLYTLYWKYVIINFNNVHVFRSANNFKLVENVL